MTEKKQTLSFWIQEWIKSWPKTNIDKKQNQQNMIQNISTRPYSYLCRIRAYEWKRNLQIESLLRDIIIQLFQFLLIESISPPTQLTKMKDSSLYKTEFFLSSLHKGEKEYPTIVLLEWVQGLLFEPIIKEAPGMKFRDFLDLQTSTSSTEKKEEEESILLAFFIQKYHTWKIQSSEEASFQQMQTWKKETHYSSIATLFQKARPDLVSSLDNR